MRVLLAIRGWISRQLGFTVGLAATCVIIVAVTIDVACSATSAGPPTHVAATMLAQASGLDNSREGGQDHARHH